MTDIIWSFKSDLCVG